VGRAQTAGPDATRDRRSCSDIGIGNGHNPGEGQIHRYLDATRPAAPQFRRPDVAALAISDDMSLRVSAEEALAEQLSKRGLRGLAAYRVVPREELREPRRAKGW
jgi:hypothetical protein